MRGKRLEARKQRLRELARIDLANRCASCKRALPAFGKVEDWVTGQRFCSWTCYDEAREVKA